MGALKKLLRNMAEPLLAHVDIDLRMTRLRLRQFDALGSELSAVFSAEDCPGQPSSRLIELALASASRARNVALPLLAERNAPSFVHLWPGEHYRLLHAIVQEIQPDLVLEIGTYKGLSALAMVSALPLGSQLTTVDIVPWDKVPGTFLTSADFREGSLAQVVCDLGQTESCNSYAPLLQEADLVFVDAAKDGFLERRLLENFSRVGLKSGALVVLDDIRFWNMLDIWRRISRPKLDFTGFGHWSGTGIVDWGGDLSA